MSSRGLFLGVPLLVVGCSGESTTLALSEPFRVHDAQFEKGALPGVDAPPDAGDDSTRLRHPTVPSASVEGGQILHAEQAGVSMKGLASKEAVSVGAALEDASSGYFLFPVGALSTETDRGDFEWHITADFGANAPTGLRNLSFVAFDSAGRPGTIRDFPICILPPFPDNLNACVPTKVPPYLVVSLDWDRPVDLDLRLVTPDGTVVDGKHRSSAKADAEGTVDPTAPGVGILDHDSNAGCVIDGTNREDVVFQTKPPPGRYFVYANLFDACGEPSVGFTVSLYSKTNGVAPNTFKMVELRDDRKSGSLLAVEANGGSQIGSFVMEFIVK